MSKFKDFYKTHKYVILWTISYAAIVWAVLMFMFNFNIFSGVQWHMLANAQLHGFAGFVFGLLILAALPMYVATTCLIIRTKQPIVNVNITFITKIFATIIKRMGPTPMVVDAPETAAIPQAEAAPTPINSDSDQGNRDFPPRMPRELRPAFIRARSRIDEHILTPVGMTPLTAVDNVAPDTTDMPGDLPLPADFDFDDTFEDDTPTISAPTFTDIDFGGNNGNDDDDDLDIAPQDTTPTITVPEFTPHTSATTQETVQYLTTHGQSAQIQNDFIISDKLVIATHDDPDFWIADPENWFAAGKQKPSPIIELIKTSATIGHRPILYLAQTNIMDLDNCISQWTKMGITVITDLSELPI